LVGEFGEYIAGTVVPHGNPQGSSGVSLREEKSVERGLAGMFENGIANPGSGRPEIRYLP
jgi:hypothetical protein